MSHPLELLGQRFTRLVVIERGPTIDQCVNWRCRCDCGNVVLVPGPTLKIGNTRSCGCLQRDTMRRHGLHKSPEYTAWCALRQRCYNHKNPNYGKYGGRGITVCDRWRESFEAFYADMGPRPSSLHSLDRIDNDGPYSPENCRWATMSMQRRNCRQNRYLTLNGRTQLICEWAAELGLSQYTISTRLQRGWSEERTLSEPLKKPHL